MANETCAGCGTLYVNVPECHLKDCLAEKVRLLNLQNDELRKALDRDKTGLAAALAAIREEVKGQRWICEGRGPYQYDDDRYRQETGLGLDAIEKLAVEALAASGKLAHEALTVKRKCQSTTGIRSDVTCTLDLGHVGFHSDGRQIAWDGK